MIKVKVTKRRLKLYTAVNVEIAYTQFGISQVLLIIKHYWTWVALYISSVTYMVGCS